MSARGPGLGFSVQVSGDALLADWKGIEMAGGKRKRLTKKGVEALLDRLKSEVKRPECWSCECLHGFIAQMEMDAAPEAKPLLAKYKVPSAKIHACAGCEPCPPAGIFAEYLIRKRTS